MLTARWMLASAANFHYVRPVSFLAVFTTVLASLLGLAITRAVSALIRFVSHDYTSTNEINFQGGFIRIVGRASIKVKTHESKRSFQHARQPMHDIQAELSIIDSGTIHSELHLIRTSQLRREHRCFT